TPLEQYVREGGRLLVVGTKEPGGLFGKPVRRWTETRSAYFRIRDHSIFPSLRNTQLLFLAGDYVEMAPVGKPLLTLIPPSMFGPPEKVHIDRVETNAPGVLMASRGQGRVAYVPWDVGSLYYRHSSPGHMGLVTDLIDHLLPNGRQLKTNAHPLVEMTVMRQPRSGRTLVHLVNISGHSSTAYFSPIEMRDIDLAITGRFKRARSVRLNRALALTQAGGHMTFSLPRLGAYDVIVLE
ncbi:MAG: hypothetical protein ACREJ5_27020, partial [Geminicoccaceae bacterium]